MANHNDMQMPGIQTKPPLQRQFMLRSRTDIGDIFEDALNAAKAVFSETNNLQKEADALQIDFAAGRTDDILAVMLAQGKAHQSLNFTVQTISKVIESYREIMRMQL
jgi:flagellar hook-basal body complex protein FliE